MKAKKIVIVQCGVCGEKFPRDEVQTRDGDATPYCPKCYEHDMIFFSHFADEENH